MNRMYVAYLRNAVNFLVVEIYKVNFQICVHVCNWWSLKGSYSWYQSQLLDRIHCFCLNVILPSYDVPRLTPARVLTLLLVSHVPPTQSVQSVLFLQWWRAWTYMLLFSKVSKVMKQMEIYRFVSKVLKNVAAWESWTAVILFRLHITNKW
jgi:hypothetical protein